MINRAGQKSSGKQFSVVNVGKTLKTIQHLLHKRLGKRFGRLLKYIPQQLNRQLFKIHRPYIIHIRAKRVHTSDRDARVQGFDSDSELTKLDPISGPGPEKSRLIEENSTRDF